MKINLSTVSSNIRIFTTVVFALACVTPGVAQSQPASTEPAVSQSKGSGQAFPTRAITVVVPFPTGGTADLLPRLIAPLLSRSLGVPVVVDNRPGASGAIGASIVAKAKPDGHTLLVVTPPILATNQWLYKDLIYSPEKDFATITNAASAPNIIAVHPSIPAKNLKEFIAFAKARPDQLSFASGGNGTTHHLCGELLKTSAGIKMLHIPYKGVGSAQQDLRSGRVPIMCDNFSNLIPLVRAGNLRALALTANTRHAQAPDIPTANESGLPGFEVSVWFGFVAPAGTPRALIDRLNTEITNALRASETAERIAPLGLTVIADSPESFARFVATEAARWREVVRVSGARVD